MTIVVVCVEETGEKETKLRQDTQNWSLVFCVYTMVKRAAFSEVDTSLALFWFSLFFGLLVGIGGCPP